LVRVVRVDALFVAVSKFPHVRAVGEQHGHRWCHMWCDPGDEQELHRIALEIGLLPGWFQRHSRLDHYDLTPPRRALAVQAGAVETSLKEWLKANPA
jgi:hypothetical protein